MIILSYDVSVDSDRKVFNIVSRYLIHRHKSVFDGYLSESSLYVLLRELREIINVEKDSILIYSVKKNGFKDRLCIGRSVFPEDDFYIADN